MSTNHDHSFLKQEIWAQPEVLARLLKQEQRNAAQIAAAVRRAGVHNVLIAARGSSDNAARYGKYLFASFARLPVTLAAPSLYTLYHTPPRLEHTLVVGISQSGRSPDILAVVEEGRRQGAPTLAITNSPDSPLAAAADFLLPLHAGEERSIAATKTYTAQLMALAMLATALGDAHEQQAALAEVPAAVGRCLETGDDRIARISERYRYMETCVVIGRGYNYATAYEIALKLKELTYIVAEPYSSADFQHGPIAMIANGFPVLLLAPQGKVYAETHALAEKLAARGAELLVFSDQAPTLALARVPVALPVSPPEWLAPFTTITLGQLFAYHLTLAKDYDPDHPRGLTKVTQTR